MTYASIDASAAEGRPYFLYQFVEGAQVWRFTSRAGDRTSAGSGGSQILWQAAAVAHGDVVQTGEIERGRLELTWPLSHPFARRFLAPMGNTAVTLLPVLLQPVFANAGRAKEYSVFPFAQTRPGLPRLEWHRRMLSAVSLTAPASRMRMC